MSMPENIHVLYIGAVWAFAGFVFTLTYNLFKSFEMCMFLFILVGAITLSFMYIKLIPWLKNANTEGI